MPCQININYMPNKKNLVHKTIIFLDLNTVPKITSFLAELVPFVGLGYAIIGYNLAGQKLKLIDRGLYIAGEFLASGHVLKAIKGNLVKQGFSKASQQLFKETSKKAGRKVAERAVYSAQQRALRGIVK